MEITPEWIIAGVSVVTAILSFLGKRKYVKIAEAVLRGVKGFVDKPKSNALGGLNEYTKRRKVEDHIKVAADRLKINGKLEQLQCSIDKKDRKVKKNLF